LRNNMTTRPSTRKLCRHTPAEHLPRLQHREDLREARGAIGCMARRLDRVHCVERVRFEGKLHEVALDTVALTGETLFRHFGVEALQLRHQKTSEGAEIFRDVHGDTERRSETQRDAARRSETQRDAARRSETQRDAARRSETQRDAARRRSETQRHAATCMEMQRETKMERAVTVSSTRRRVTAVYWRDAHKRTMTA
jgi:hypothetical protein